MAFVGGPMIRVVAHTEEPLLSKAVQDLLAAESDICLIASTNESSALVHHCVPEHPDVVLISNSAAYDSAVLKNLRRQCPHTAVVLWISEIAPELAHQSIE